MICVSIGDRAVPRIQSVLRAHRCVELRLDMIRPSDEALHALFRYSRTIIATCRPGLVSSARRMDLLLRAVELGASYVDIETTARPALREAVLRASRQNGCRVIFSYHNHQTTPRTQVLESIVGRAFSEGADVVKVACQVREAADNVRLLALLQHQRWRGRLIITGMGRHGRITRIVAPLLGSRLAFVRAVGSRPTAPGQLTSRELEAAWSLLRRKR